MRGGQLQSILLILVVAGVVALASWEISKKTIKFKTLEEQKERQGRIKIEMARVSIANSLYYSSLQAALKVAENGGTVYPVTYWWCGDPQPPELEEVLFALSNYSQIYFETYLQNLRERYKSLNIEISEYKCVGIKPPAKETCGVVEENGKVTYEPSKECNHFETYASKGLFEVHDPINITYKGSILADNGPVRFWKVYYTLYSLFNSGEVREIITRVARENCPEPTPVKYKLALEEVCKKVEELIDPEYIECEVEKLNATIHEDCKRQAFTNLCFKFSPNQFLKYSTEEGKWAGKNSVNFEEVSYYFIIRITDKKYRVFGKDYLVWNIHLAFPELEIECAPVNA